MIELNKYEVMWILICKGHYKNIFPEKKNMRWHNYLKPLWFEIYGWNPDDPGNEKDYLKGIFNKLLSIHIKIQESRNDNWHIEEIFAATFSKGISNDAQKPIERGIHALCSLIQNTLVIDSFGEKRFDLDEGKEEVLLRETIKK